MTPAQKKGGFGVGISHPKKPLKSSAEGGQKGGYYLMSPNDTFFSCQKTG